MALICLDSLRSNYISIIISENCAFLCHCHCNISFYIYSNPEKVGLNLRGYFQFHIFNFFTKFTFLFKQYKWVNTLLISIILKFKFFQKAAKSDKIFPLIWIQINWVISSNICGLLRKSEISASEIEPPLIILHI